jgi:hypothetical protein
VSAWIESHQTLRDHPRKDQLAEELFSGTIPDDAAEYAAVGLLHYLWWWALDYAQDGDLAPFSDRQIAKACRYAGDPTALVAALTRSGFITEERTLHDWYDYAGRLIEKREANAARNRAYRAAKHAPSASRAHHERTPSAPRERLRDALPNQTEPNHTEPSSNPLADASAPARREVERDFAEWWSVYGRVGNKAKCLDNYEWWRTVKKTTAGELLRAAIAYRAHCEQTDCPMQHGSTFLAKSQKNKRARWPEWAAGEEHGTIHVRDTSELADVLAAGARTFHLGDDHDRAIGRTTHPRVGADARRSLPAGGVADEE